MQIKNKHLQAVAVATDPKQLRQECQYVRVEIHSTGYVLTAVDGVMLVEVKTAPDTSAPLDVFYIHHSVVKAFAKSTSEYLTIAGQILPVLTDGAVAITINVTISNYSEFPDANRVYAKVPKEGEAPHYGIGYLSTKLVQRAEKALECLAERKRYALTPNWVCTAPTEPHLTRHRVTSPGHPLDCEINIIISPQNSDKGFYSADWSNE